MNAAAWALIVFFILEAICVVALINRRRAPITPGTAAFHVAACALGVVLVLVAVS